MKNRLLSRLVSILLVMVFVFTSIPTAFAATSSSALKITKQPTSVAVAKGQTAKVQVSATGTGLSYTWYYKNKGGSKFAVDTVIGNKSAYTVKMDEKRDGRKLFCIVKDKYGKKVQTNTVALTMKESLQITKQPVSVTVSNGTTAKVQVMATGKNLSYTWYYKNKGGSKFAVDTVIGNKSTYAVTMNASRNGRQLYCVVKDAYGKKIQTNTVTIAMKTPLAITAQPASSAKKIGEKHSVKVVATGKGLSYTWYYKNKGDSKFAVDTVIGNRSTYTVNVSAANNGRQLYCIVKDAYGKKVQTRTITLTTAPALKITKQPQSVRVAKGETVKLTVAAKGDGLTYQWYYKDLNTSTFKKSTLPKSNVYTVAMTTAKHGQQLYCKITDKYGDSIDSNVVTLSTSGAAPSSAPVTKNCKACAAKPDGTTFGYDTVYTQKNKLKKQPLTFEAVVQIQQKDIDPATLTLSDRTASYVETVLFSSDATYEATVNYSITEDGHPKLAIRPTKWFRRAYNFVFDDVNVFSSKPVHVAITFDKSNNKVKCYVDGILKQTISSIPTAAKTAVNSKFNYAVGGDLYSSNLNYFRGKLYNLSVWSDIRSGSEIAKDYLNGVTTSDSALMASYNLMGCDSCMLKDYSSNSNKLYAENIWNTKESVEPVGDFDYSFAVLGDTQELSEDDPEGFAQVYQWIADNKDTHKIEYMLGLGDITQKSYSYEWEHAKKQIYKLNGSIPYLLSRGNHDWDTIYDGKVVEGFSSTFNDGIYNKQQVTGVMTEGRMENAYRTINICGIDYLFMALDFGPNAEMLDWANSVVEAHPNHRVVVITHGYMYHDGTTLGGDDLYPASTHPIRCRKDQQSKKPSLDGDDMWEQFVSKHENVQLVLSGHDPAQHIVYRQDQGDKGNTVTQMLIDPQHIDGFYEPTGMVAMFYFSDNGNKLTVRYYSVLKDLYGSERSQFTIDLTK